MSHGYDLFYHNYRENEGNELYIFFCIHKSPSINVIKETFEIFFAELFKY